MNSIRFNPIARATMVAAALVAGIMGCNDDSKSPVEPTTTPAFATAATLFFSQVSAGGSHTCGLTPENRAYCWGENSSGQLGNGTTVSSSKPVAVAGGLRFVQISAGADHTCGVATTAKAYCWGANRNYQTGTSSSAFVLTPAAVSGGRSYRMVRAGYDHTCGVTPWNAGFCWGENRFGNLGANSTISSTPDPLRVAGGLQWSRIVAGGHYSCGITTEQRAYCWGYNGSGRLGDGTFTTRRKPVPVASTLRFRLIVAGGGGFDDDQGDSPTTAHTCAVTTDNKGYCWGRVGPNTNNTPVAVGGTRKWDQLIAGYTHRCGVTTSDVAFCWGENESGQLGNGTTTLSNTPVRVAGSLLFSAVTLGTAGRHSCGLTTGNRVYCWGNNESGQLGDGTHTMRVRPVAVVGP